MFSSKLSFTPDEQGDFIALDSPLPINGDMPAGDYGAAFVKMFLTLIALILLFAISTWFLRRLIRQRWEKGSGTQIIRIIEKRMISAKTMLYVIEVDNQKIVVAESHLEVKQLHISPGATNSTETM